MAELSIELQITMFLFFALLGYLVALRINQSAVVGVILVGIIAGPSVFNLITYTKLIEALAHIGAIVLLFAVGLEFEITEIYKPKYVIIAISGMVVPFIFGYITGILFGYPFSASLLIATALIATSIAITASVLLEMGKLNTETAKTIIGAAVVDDILTLIVLSITTQIVQGCLNAIDVIIDIVKAILFVGSGIFIGKFMRKFFIKLDETKVARKFPDFLFIFVMMIAFLYSFIAEFIGLSGIIGAFVAGTTFTGVHFKNSKDLKEGAEYMHIIFAAIFFISLGILADIHTLSYESIIFIIVLTVIAILSKILGCFVPARLFKMKSKDAFIVGVGMTPRGEVGMIVALLGLTSGVLPQSIYVSLIIVSILSTLIAPVMLRQMEFK
ncbi:MAG: cation:proton antiporter [candidate division WOR-3 bacterium]|nr:cation:proton antiporter [candidate division WOR-3 bacterium]